VATIEVTEANFGATVQQDGIVLIDLWAEWCGPCRMFGPIFEAASEANSDIVFGKVDTEANQGLAAALDVRSIPTLMAFRDGVMLFNQAGALPEANLNELIGAIRNVDMDAVHAEIAKANSGESAE
jgi:thioredoxin 1